MFRYCLSPYTLYIFGPQLMNSTIKFLYYLIYHKSSHIFQLTCIIIFNAFKNTRQGIMNTSTIHCQVGTSLTSEFSLNTEIFLGSLGRISMHSSRRFWPFVDRNLRNNEVNLYTVTHCNESQERKNSNMTSSRGFLSVYCHQNDLWT